MSLASTECILRRNGVLQLLGIQTFTGRGSIKQTIAGFSCFIIRYCLYHTDWRSVEYTVNTDDKAYSKHPREALSCFRDPNILWDKLGFVNALARDSVRMKPCEPLPSYVRRTWVDVILQSGPCNYAMQ